MSQPNPPDTDEYWNDLGIRHAIAGRNAEAIAAFERAIQISPKKGGAYINVGQLLAEAGRWDEAIDAFTKAATAQPPAAPAFTYLFAALSRKSDSERIIMACRECLAAQPENESIALTLGGLLCNIGRHAEAVTVYSQLLSRNFSLPTTHMSLGHALLNLGKYLEAWPELDWQWQIPDAPQRPSFTQPRWDGSDLAGKRILIYTEQGYGDAIHLARYTPLVTGRGGRVQLVCFSEVFRLFQRVANVDKVVGSGQPMSEFDVHCSVYDLPRIFQTTPETIPSLPYLSADPAESAKWKARISPWKDRLKVGLAWAGNPKRVDNQRRSLSLADLAPLAQSDGVHFFSLQKGDAATQTQTPPPGMQLTDWTADLNDFADTAALVDNLDLVITIDTVVLHLAGAMGKPIWALLAMPLEWRWLADRNASPWYPTSRSFRQPVPGDWKTPIGHAAEALKRFP